MGNQHRPAAGSPGPRPSRRGVSGNPYIASAPDPPSPQEIDRLIEERNQARKAGDFRKADAIRDDLGARGVVLKDEKRAKGDLSGQQVTTWRYWDDEPPQDDLPPQG